MALSMMGRLAFSIFLLMVVVAGQKSDGQHSDGQQSDSQHSNGQQSDGQHSDGQQSDGHHSDGQQSGDQNSDGKQSDGQHSDNGHQSDGQHSDNGQQSDGQHSDNGQNSDGQHGHGHKTYPPPPPPPKHKTYPPPPPPPEKHLPPTKYSPPPPPIQITTPPPSPPPPSIPTPSSPPPSPPVSTPSSPPPSPPISTPSSPPPSPPVSTPSPPPPSPPISTPSSPPPSPPISTPSPPPPSTPHPTPSSSPTPPKKAKCNNPGYPHCDGVELTCPSSCPQHCEVICSTCKPACACDMPGAVCQDPRFTGGDGITFYFHGKKDRDFCIVSDSNLHINAHFIGKRNYNMKRDFTWVQSIGILFDDHQLSVGAQKVAIWDNTVDHIYLSFDGENVLLPQYEGATWSPRITPGVTFKRSLNTNSVEIEVEGNFKIKATVVPITEKESRVHNYDITQDNCFAHLDLGFKFYSLSDDVNGVLGQTYASNYTSRVKMGVPMPVLGGVKEFSSSSLFSTDCAVARFFGHSNSTTNGEYPNLNCGSGIHGRGVVCKR